MYMGSFIHGFNICVSWTIAKTAKINSRDKPAIIIIIAGIFTGNYYSSTMATNAFSQIYHYTGRINVYVSSLFN